MNQLLLAKLSPQSPLEANLGSFWPDGTSEEGLDEELRYSWSGWPVAGRKKKLLHQGESNL